MEEKKKYLLGVKSNSRLYPVVRYYGTLRGAKVACTRLYGKAIYTGEHLLIETEGLGDNFVCEKFEDGWRD